MKKKEQVDEGSEDEIDRQKKMIKHMKSNVKSSEAKAKGKHAPGSSSKTAIQVDDSASDGNSLVESDDGERKKKGPLERAMEEAIARMDQEKAVLKASSRQKMSKGIQPSSSTASSSDSEIGPLDHYGADAVSVTSSDGGSSIISNSGRKKWAAPLRPAREEAWWSPRPRPFRVQPACAGRRRRTRGRR